MKREEVQKLPYGLYRIYWKDGEGSSLAAVGGNHAGERWMAPTNWVSISNDYSSSWDEVEKVKPILLEGWFSIEGGGVKGSFGGELCELVATRIRQGGWKDSWEESLETLCHSCDHFSKAPGGEIHHPCSALQVGVRCKNHQVDGD